MSSVKRLIFKRQNNSEKNGIEHKAIIYGFRMVLALITIAVIVFLFPISSLYQSLNLPSEGSIAKEDVTAPFTFPILKSEEELKQDKSMVLSNLPVILNFNPAKEESIATELRIFFARVDSINQAYEAPETRVRSLRLAFPQLEEEGILFLSTSADLKMFSSNLLSILKEFYQTGMVKKVGGSAIW